MSKISIPHEIIQSATNAQIKRAGANFAESVAAYLGNPITGEIKVSSTDKKGLYWIFGLGSEPQSVFTAVNNGLPEDKLYFGTPIYVYRGVNGYIIDRPNPDASPDFFDGAEARNDQMPVYMSNFYYGTTHPYGTSLQLLVIGAQYDDDDVVDIITDDFVTGTVQDTLAANIVIPTTNNTAIGVLVQIDPTTETLSYKQSASYAATIKPRQAYRAGLLPTVDANRFRVAYFNLTYGMTAFTYGDIWSCPEFISSGDSILNNYIATTAPTANDDSGDGYSVGSQWFDVTNDKIYFCIDATLTAAIWIEVVGRTQTQTLTNKTLSASANTIGHGTGVIKTLASDVCSAGTDRNIIVAAQTGTSDTLREITGLAIGESVLVRADAGDTITVSHNDGAATVKIILTSSTFLIPILNENTPLRLTLVATNVLAEDSLFQLPYFDISSNGTFIIESSTFTDAFFMDVTDPFIPKVGIGKTNGSLADDYLLRLFTDTGGYVGAFGLPEVTTSDRSGLTVDEGALVYDTDINAAMLNNANGWLALLGVIGSYIGLEPPTLRWLANDKLIVTGGTTSHGVAFINKVTGKVLTMGTAIDWIDGSSAEAASTWAHVYTNIAGDYYLHDTMPNNSSPVANVYIATMRVNQSGWNGTAGNGLNATSVVYDTDTGEGSIVAGMLLGVYSDSAYTLGRGKGSAASATLNDMSFALITAVNTGTNTLTLEAGHQIAMNDNDYLIVIENAPVLYRYEASVSFRWLGAMFNNASSNLDPKKEDNLVTGTHTAGSNYTSNSTSMTPVDSTNLKATIIAPHGGLVDVSFSFAGNKGTGGNGFWGITDGNISSDEVGLRSADGTSLITVTGKFHCLPGTIPLTLQYRSSDANLVQVIGTPLPATYKVSVER